MAGGLTHRTTRHHPAPQVDASAVDVSKFGDAYFKAAEKKAYKKSEGAFFAEQATEKAALPAEVVANQKAVDAALLGKLRCGACVCGVGWGVGGEVGGAAGGSRRSSSSCSVHC